ncbi:Uridylate kinase [Candidatus Fokinia solitaria]|uniref:Uridylate kinase n=1 Tax=Candidatus Fokinia solitaria TaxID=1802984 RepID=A0A2U8BSP1_9RICK|nr:UMP kinase [Candidatus Fokinia solitaria]AWD33374.1 Uridylate kinase [Candidatus Fokinia solitaria]
MLKLSGEALRGQEDASTIWDFASILRICQDLQRIYAEGIGICIVVGGGNICRGTTLSKIGIERVRSDQMGMLATVMNSIAIQSVFDSLNVESRLQSALSISQCAEQYVIKRGLRHLEKKRVLIFSGGTGNPFFTTDTGAVLRALEMKCDVMIKGTGVDGIYCSDPRKNPNAVLYKELNYDQAIEEKLGIADSTAMTMARDGGLPLLVCNIHKPKILSEIVFGLSKEYSVVKCA